MAGRPKMKYRKVDALAREMESLGQRLQALMPEQYKADGATRDQL